MTSTQGPPSHPPAEAETEHDASAAAGARRLGVRVVDEAEPQSGSMTVNGVRLHYLDWGREGQPTLLCLHGGRANAHVWDFAALGLRHLYRVVALDQRGHGDSGWDGARRYERDAYVSDLEGVVRELGAGPVILAAHSMGGTNSLVFAGRHPSLVRALVLVDAGPEIAPDSYERSERITSAVPDWGDYAAYVAQAQRYSRWWPPWQVHYHLRYALRELSEGVWTWKGDPATRSPERREGRGHQHDPRELWPVWEGLRCPALVVRGSFSRILLAPFAREMERRLGHSRLVEVAGAGHRVMEDRPAEFAAVVSTFLADVVAGSGESGPG